MSGNKMSIYLDKTGREIKAGDLLKLPHFTAYNRRKIFMYKLVFRVDKKLKITEDGDYLYAVDVVDIYRKGVNGAHKCPLSVVGECEIIDDASPGADECFWERKKVKIYERLGRSDSNSVNRDCDSDGRCESLEKGEKNESQDHSSRS